MAPHNSTADHSQAADAVTLRAQSASFLSVISIDAVKPVGGMGVRHR